MFSSNTSKRVRSSIIIDTPILFDERPELALVEDAGRLLDQVGELRVPEQGRDHRVDVVDRPLGHLEPQYECHSKAALIAWLVPSIFETGCQKLDSEGYPSKMRSMNAAEQIAPTITEPLTWAEICERYPDEWVCVVDIDYDHPRVFDFRTARVVSHSKTKREAFDQASPWWDHYKLIGRYFTGHLTVRPFLRPSIILDDETRDAFRYQR